MNLQNTQLIIYLTTPPNMADLQQRTKSKKRSIEVRTFIETVRKFPCLYNKNAKGYKDAMMKSALWNKIGEKMQMSGDEAEKKWKIQRDRYNKERKKAKESLSDGGPCYTPTWFLYDLMDVILSSPNQEETSLIPVKEEVDPDTLMATGHLPMANNLEICEADEIPTEMQSIDLGSSRSSLSQDVIQPKKRQITSNFFSSTLPSSTTTTCSKNTFVERQTSFSPGEKEHIEQFCDLLKTRLMKLDNRDRYLSMKEIELLMLDKEGQDKYF